MANNRMWLIYKPTGHAVCLAKRMGDGYYMHDPAELGEQLLKLFDIAETKCFDGKGGLDDFAIGFEDPGNNPHSFNDWKYQEDQEPGEVRQLKLTNV